MNNMSQTQELNQETKTNEIQIRKNVYLFLHNDSFTDNSLEPLILVNGEKIHLVLIKKKYPYDMYYFLESKKYLKLWNDKKGNILTYFSNWSGDLFVNQPQTVEYIDDFTYTAGSNELICKDKDGIEKRLILEGFDIIPLSINQFTKYEDAIFYILCTKLS